MVVLGEGGRGSCTYYNMVRGRLEVTEVLYPQGSPSADLFPPVRYLPSRLITASPNNVTIWVPSLQKSVRTLQIQTITFYDHIIRHRRK